MKLRTFVPGWCAMAKTKGMTLLEFQRKFSHERVCLEHLFQLRWGNGFVCPRCQGNKFYFIEKRMLYECSSCGHQTSLTAGTIMHKTKLPLLVWFWAIYLVAYDKRGRCALSLAQVLNLDYRTAWRLLHKIRCAMKTAGRAVPIGWSCRDGRHLHWCPQVWHIWKGDYEAKPLP
jgi:transposase-like protein